MISGEFMWNDQDNLRQIEATNRQLLATVKTFQARTNLQYLAFGYGIPSHEFPPFVGVLENFDRVFAQYAATRSAAVQSRLAGIVPDLQKAIGIYRQMYQQALDAEGNRARIMTGAASYQTGVMKSVNHGMQQTFDRVCQTWREYFAR